MSEEHCMIDRNGEDNFLNIIINNGSNIITESGGKEYLQKQLF